MNLLLQLMTRVRLPRHWCHHTVASCPTSHGTKLPVLLVRHCRHYSGQPRAKVIGHVHRTLQVRHIRYTLSKCVLRFLFSHGNIIWISSNNKATKWHILPMWKALMDFPVDNGTRHALENLFAFTSEQPYQCSCMATQSVNSISPTTHEWLSRSTYS